MLRVRVFALLVAVSLGAGACATSADPGAAPSASPAGTAGGQAVTAPVRVLVSPFLSFAPFYLARDEGYFEDEGITVEFEEVAGGSVTMAPLLASGDIDVWAGPGTPALFLLSREGVRVVADKGHVADEGCPYSSMVVMPETAQQDGFGSADWIAGKRIGAPAATVFAQWYAEQVVSSLGASVEDVEMVDLPFPAGPEALANGAIDILYTLDPFLSQAINGSGAVTWKPIEEVAPGTQVAVVAYGRRLAETDRDAGVAFMRAYLRGVAQYNEGKTDRNLEVLSQAMGQDRSFLEGACWPPVHGDGALNVDSLQTIQRWGVDHGFQDAMVAPEEFVDTAFLTDAMTG